MKILNLSVFCTALVLSVQGGPAMAQAPISVHSPNASGVNHPKIDMKWLGDVGDFLSKRLTTIYGGTESFERVMNSGKALRGVIGISGDVLRDFNEGTMTRLLPFQVEMNSDRTYRISLSLVGSDFAPEAGDRPATPIGSFKFLNFTYDDRVPGRVDRMMSIEGDIAVPLINVKSGWVGPRAAVQIGSRSLTYQIQSMGYATPNGVQEFAHNETGFSMNTQVGVAFDQHFLNFSLNGFAGFGFNATGNANEAEKGSDASAAAEGSLTNLDGQIVSRQAMLDLNLTRGLGKKGNRVGVFYQGRFARKATFRNTFEEGVSYDITQLELVTPHRVGLRLDLAH